MSMTTVTARQRNFFQKTLMEQLNPQEPLMLLSRRIPWGALAEQFSSYYADCGRPSKDIRLMIGLLILKQLENLSDERLVVEWTRNPYYQAFCGMLNFQWEFPCDPSDISRFRRRIGDEGCGKILRLSVQLLQPEEQGKAHAFAEEVIIDSTVQEKAVTYPTDSKLYVKLIEYAVKIGNAEGVRFRQTYPRMIRKLKRIVRFSRGRKIGEAVKAVRTLRTYAGRVLRNLEAGLSEERRAQHAEFITNANKILRQKKGDTARIRSISEPQVACITKGKSGKKHEYGNKVSICMDRRTCIIVGVASFTGNPHDSSTPGATLRNVEEMTGRIPVTARCDRGRRGRPEVNGTRIAIPQAPRPSDPDGKRREARKNFGRRSAIEPVIGHLKNDHRMARNFLKGALGDSINLIMAAAAFNFKKWLRGMPPALFCVPDVHFCASEALSALQMIFTMSGSRLNPKF